MSEFQSQSDQQTEKQTWEPCARGTITGMVKTIKRHRNQQTLRDIALASGCILISFLLANEFLKPPVKLTHAQVVQMADEFINGTLPSSMVTLVEQHISVCPRCEHLLEERDKAQRQTFILLPDETVVAVDVAENDLFVAAR